MKSSILILNICAVLISTFSISSAFAENNKKLEAVLIWNSKNSREFGMKLRITPGFQKIIVIP
jgi:hypothetical protein